ncbi:MAG: fumarate hydratase [Pseudomonadota bacterium]
MHRFKELNKKNVLELIRKASCELPLDIEKMLISMRAKEDKKSAAYMILGSILDNVALARNISSPICQDTGTLLFYVTKPFDLDSRKLIGVIKKAVLEATNKSYLRPNTVDPITGTNSGDNLGNGHPYIHFTDWSKKEIEIKLLLKGGGSENASIQYKLPDASLKAGRDLAGVEKVILDSVFKAQGKGCAPGILGVGIGGDRQTSYQVAKKQLFRSLADKNENPKLAKLESNIFKKANLLNIGPMGLMGKTTLLGVKIGCIHRLPACYFVSVAYLCWAARKASLNITTKGVKYA